MHPFIMRTNSGATLLLTLILMTVLAVFVSVFLNTVLTTNRNADNQMCNARAFYLAEAGVHKAVWYLLNTAPNGTTDGSWRTTAYPAAAGSNPTDPKNESLGGGNYTMWVQNSGVDSPQSILITAKGTYNGVSRTLHERIINSTGLVARWKLDEGSGTTTADASGSAHTGTLVGGIGWVTGKIGNAVKGNGSGQYVSTTGNIGLSGNAARSISLWFNRTTTTGGKTLVGYGAATAGNLFDFLCLNNTLVLNISGTMTTTSAPTYTAGSWNHAVVTYDGTFVRVYLNGTLGNTTTLALNTTNSTVVLASGVDPAYQNLDGAVDDVRVYNRTLTATEINLLYRQTRVVSGSWAQN